MTKTKWHFDFIVSKHMFCWWEAFGWPRSVHITSSWITRTCDYRIVYIFLFICFHMKTNTQSNCFSNRFIEQKIMLLNHLFIVFKCMSRFVQVVTFFLNKITMFILTFHSILHLDQIYHFVHVIIIIPIPFTTRHKWNHSIYVDKSQLNAMFNVNVDIISFGYHENIKNNTLALVMYSDSMNLWLI